MKELSIEEKAKAYDEALERAKFCLITDMDKSGHWAVNYIFPTLKESDDERIRKELLEHCKNQAKPYIYTGNKCPQIQSWIDWLEKQSKENMIEALRMEYEKGKADVLQEQRKEWSEEDERIRKAIISLIQNGGYMSKEFKEKAFSWLEKQRYSEFELENEYWRGYDDAKFHLKEDKVTVIGARSNSTSVSDGDNSITSKEVVSHLTVTGSDGGKCTTASTTFEPMFKVRDWITDGKIVFHIASYHIDYGYQLETTEGISFYLSDERVENKYHLWTIQDAKDGDIIYIKRHKNNSEWLLIFKEIKSQNTLIDVYDYYAYSITTNNTYHQGFYGLWGLLLDDEIVCPATKEQCNLLFAKMKEEGYKWDAEKKDLKKISQEYPLTPDECTKSAWNEEDERIYYSLLADIRTRQDGSTNTLEAYYNEQIDWLKSIKEKLKGE